MPVPPPRRPALFLLRSPAPPELHTLSLHDALPIYGSRNRATELEAGTAVTAQAQALRAMGHEVREQPFPSGTHVIRWTQNGLERSEEHTSELQSRENLVCRLLLEKKNKKYRN